MRIHNGVLFEEHAARSVATTATPNTQAVFKFPMMNGQRSTASAELQRAIVAGDRRRLTRSVSRFASVGRDLFANDLFPVRLKIKHHEDADHEQRVDRVAFDPK
jgi:hypothetical protein